MGRQEHLRWKPSWQSVGRVTRRHRWHDGGLPVARPRSRRGGGIYGADRPLAWGLLRQARSAGACGRCALRCRSVSNCPRIRCPNPGLNDSFAEISLQPTLTLRARGSASDQQHQPQHLGDAPFGVRQLTHPRSRSFMRARYRAAGSRPPCPHPCRTRGRRRGLPWSRRFA